MVYGLQSGDGTCLQTITNQYCYTSS